MTRGGGGVTGGSASLILTLRAARSSLVFERRIAECAVDADMLAYVVDDDAIAGSANSQERSWSSDG